MPVAYRTRRRCRFRIANWSYPRPYGTTSDGNQSRGPLADSAEEPTDRSCARCCDGALRMRDATTASITPGRAGVTDFDAVADRGEATAVGAEDHARDPFGVETKHERLVAGGRVPDLDGLVVTGRCDAITVGAERQRGDRGRVGVRETVCRPEAGSRIRMSPSIPVEAQSRPSRLKVTRPGVVKPTGLRVSPP